MTFFRIASLGALAYVLSTFAGLSEAPGQDSRHVAANAAITQPVKQEPLSDWLSAPTNARVEIAVSGAVLRGWVFQGRASSFPAIIFFNSDGMTVDTGRPIYELLASCGPTVYAVDYRGIGFSSGMPDIAGFQRDSLTLYDVVARTHEHVLAYGYSLGTAIATFLDSQRHLEGLVLAAPIATGPEAYAAWIAFAGSDNNAEPAVLDPDFLRDFDEVAAVTKSKTPLLVIHGLVDRLIPVQQAREVMAASSSEHKQLLEIPDASHFGLPNRPEAIQAFRAFVQFTMSKRTLLPSSTVGL